MLSGTTCKAVAIAGNAVLRMVVSSDSMKNATATSHGSMRLADSVRAGVGMGLGKTPLGRMPIAMNHTPVTRALCTSTSFSGGYPLVLLGVGRRGHGRAGHQPCRGGAAMSALGSHFGDVDLRIATGDRGDVEIRIRNSGFVDPFANERRDRNVRVDTVKGAQREVEILATVA